MNAHPDWDYRSVNSYTKCGECGARHVDRWRRPGWCLACDLRDRHAAGDTVRALSIYTDLPPYVIERVVKP